MYVQNHVGTEGNGEVDKSVKSTKIPTTFYFSNLKDIKDIMKQIQLTNVKFVEL